MKTIICLLILVASASAVNITHDSLSSTERVLREYGNKQPHTCAGARSLDLANQYLHQLYGEPYLRTIYFDICRNEIRDKDQEHELQMEMASAKYRSDTEIERIKAMQNPEYIKFELEKLQYDDKKLEAVKNVLLFLITTVLIGIIAGIFVK